VTFARGRKITLFGVLGALLVVAAIREPPGDIPANAPPDFRREARRAVARDRFPVFDDPEPSSAEAGDAALRPDDYVIGVERGGAARAYPIAVMGVHELGNDTLGGEPIAVSW